MEMHPLPEDQLVLVRGSELYVCQSVYAYADGADMMIPSWVVDKIEDGSVTLSLYDKKGKLMDWTYQFPISNTYHVLSADDDEIPL